MKNRKKIISILAGIMAAVMVLSLIFSLIPHASAASSSELKKQLNELKNQRSEIQAKMKDLKNSIQETDDEILKIVNEKNIIDQEIGMLYAEIININEQIASYNLLIADKQDELDQAEARYEELSEKNKDRVRTMEEEGELSYWAVLFKANSFSDLLDRLNMIEEIAASDQRRLEELGKAADAVTAAKDELQLEKDAVEATRAELADTEAKLEEKRKEADELIKELVEKGEEFEALLHEAEGKADELTADISDKQKEYEAAKASEEAAYWAAYWATYVPPATEATEATTGSGTTSSGTTTNSGTSAPSSGGSWIIPCSYRYVSSPFGKRESPTPGASSYHQGIDLAAPADTPIVASRGGTVITAAYGNSGGFQVVIDHGDGFRSYYLHMNRYIVGAGQKVSQGQVIGYVGSTGISTGNHLHFGIRTSSGYVNPAAYVAFY